MGVSCITFVVPAHLDGFDILVRPPDNPADARNVPNVFAVFVDLDNLPFDTKKAFMRVKQSLLYVFVVSTSAPSILDVVALLVVHANRVFCFE